MPRSRTRAMGCTVERWCRGWGGPERRSWLVVNKENQVSMQGTTNVIRVEFGARLSVVQGRKGKKYYEGVHSSRKAGRRTRPFSKRLQTLVSTVGPHNNSIAVRSTVTVKKGRKRTREENAGRSGEWSGAEWAVSIPGLFGTKLVVPRDPS